MKCPNCGKWNQATLPHCIYCGAALEKGDNTFDAELPAWQNELKDDAPPSTYMRIDDEGIEDGGTDPREELARQMVLLKQRKLEGEQQQRLLRANAARRGLAPSGRSVRTTSNRSTFFSSYDNPDSTLRPVAPELVEEGEVDQDAQIVYTAKYRGSDTAKRTHASDDPYGYGVTQRDMYQGQLPGSSQSVYDGYHDTSSYIPSSHQDTFSRTNSTSRLNANWKPRRFGLRRILPILVVLSSLALCYVLVFQWIIPTFFSNKADDTPQVTVTATIRNDLAAHTITIPGEDGQRISIRERKTSAIVTGGVATFDIPDHVWYDDSEDYLMETMPVTLTPFLITDTGKQTPLPLIEYEIEIPLSPIELMTPDSLVKNVSTPMYTIKVQVREGSSLYVNGEDYSDLVNTDGGLVSYNATVQPIGENRFEFVVHSQYCRENRMVVTLVREVQSIPLDLASDIGSRTTSKVMEVRASTLPGATVNVLSEHTDLNITNIDSTGAFSFFAVFNKIGDNTISITADFPGKETTQVDYNVYYVPSIDVYSRAAWAMNSAGYYELLDNLAVRVKRSQIYVCIGEMTSIETSNPQRGFIQCGTEEEPLLVYIENSTQTTWVEGKKYRLYADAFGTYSGKPWLVARYTYDP